MNKLHTLLFLAITYSFISFGQKGKDVLLTIDGNPVYAKEFKRVYNKNLDLVQEESQKSVDGYLNLFIEYKLKVAEAYAQNLNKNAEYISDFSKYEEQLSRNYIYDTKVAEDLLQEAYERGLVELEASHILIKCDLDAFPQDSLTAYNKIFEIRKRALSGEDFNELAKKTSEEPGVLEREGELGYFSVFTMVYPFETEAYNTPVGEISNIVRTQFGYHIIKVTNKRKKLPTINVSHIMVSTMKDTNTTRAKERINEIYGLLKQGESFENLAKQYSDDKATAAKGGELRAFSKGDLKAPTFEEAAYALQNPGDISEPVKTDFGWHIIRLEKRNTIPTFEEQKKELETKINSGDRLKIVSSSIKNKIKKKYGFTGYDYLPFFQKYVNDSVLIRKWKYVAISEKDNKTIFTIGTKSHSYHEFANYIFERQDKAKLYKQKKLFLETLYDEFETDMLNNYFKEELEKENDEYAGIIQEYRDGLLIFEVMEKNVWSKAKKDTLEQKEFFNKNIDKYQWKKRVDAFIFNSSKKENLLEVQNLLQQNKTPEEIKAQMNKDNKVNILLTSGVFELDSKEIPSNFEAKEGLSKIYEGDTTFTLLQVNAIVPPGPKKMEEVKGRVISDYQNEVEKNWVQSLKEKYEVEVNNNTLKKIKKELGS
ncbi:MAG: peptidylprolyl isomerase [Flavobacteriaceae bacterium]